MTRRVGGYREVTADEATLRAHVAQREFFDRYREGDWLPYVWRSFETLPARVDEHLAEGRPVAADYDLLCAERFAEVLTYEQFSARVMALPPIEVVTCIDGHHYTGA